MRIYNREGVYKIDVPPIDLDSICMIYPIISNISGSSFSVLLKGISTPVTYLNVRAVTTGEMTISYFKDRILISYNGNDSYYGYDNPIEDILLKYIDNNVKDDIINISHIDISSGERIDEYKSFSNVKMMSIIALSVELVRDDLIKQWEDK